MAIITEKKNSTDSAYVTSPSLKGNWKKLKTNTNNLTEQRHQEFITLFILLVLRIALETKKYYRYQAR